MIAYIHGYIDVILVRLITGSSEHKISKIYMKYHSQQISILASGQLPT